MPIAGACMVPHPPISVAEIGRSEEKKIQSTLNAFDRVARHIADIKPDTIILISPHATMYADYFHISPGRAASGDFSNFNAPNVSFNVKYDTELAQKIAKAAERVGLPAGIEGERDPRLDHGTMVPLYFIDKYYQNYSLVRMGLSGLSLEAHYALGRAIDDAADHTDKKIVIVASGDLSHCQKKDGPYGYRPEGPEYDEKLMEVMKRCALCELLKFDEGLLDASQECGHRSFVIMAGALHSHEISSEVLSHEATFGVGYGFTIFSLHDKPAENITKKKEADIMDAYVKLARDTIYSYVKKEKKPDLTGLPDEMLTTRAGAFVSIHEFGMLRGCIGTISPTCDSVAEEIRQNAVSAAARDPRFSPITEDELDALEINVDVLGEAEPISSPDALDVKRYGVIVENGMRRGLLLPDLDGVDSVEQQIAIAREKAGIRPSEDISLSRFEVVRHV